MPNKKLSKDQHRALSIAYRRYFYKRGLWLKESSEAILNALVKEKYLKLKKKEPSKNGRGMSAVYMITEAGINYIGLHGEMQPPTLKDPRKILSLTDVREIINDFLVKIGEEPISQSWVRRLAQNQDLRQETGLPYIPAQQVPFGDGYQWVVQAGHLQAVWDSVVNTAKVREKERKSREIKAGRIAALATGLGVDGIDADDLESYHDTFMRELGIEEDDPDNCDSCHGVGKMNGNPYHLLDCRECGGSGKKKIE